MTRLELATKTGHVLVVDEDYTRGGLSGEIAAVVAESGMGARFARVTCEGTIPYARALEAGRCPASAGWWRGARLLGRVGGELRRWTRSSPCCCW